MTATRALALAIDWLFLALEIGIRVAAIAAVYAVPMGLAAFAEWTVQPGNWSLATRSVVAVIWLATTALLIVGIFGEPRPGVRKADGF